jgi:hypothetical protein
MPVTYRIDKARGIIRTRCVGAVTFDEVIGHFRELEHALECAERLDVLLDLSELASLPHAHQLRAVGQEIGRIGDRIRFDHCAIVARTDVVFGMMRMFEVFAAERFRSIGVFREEGEAETWLTSQALQDGRGDRRSGAPDPPVGRPGQRDRTVF